MFVNASPSRPDTDAHAAAALASVRVRGGYRIGVAAAAASGSSQAPATRLTDLDERGGWRVRFPDSDGTHLDAVTINTGGGILGGDQVVSVATIASGDLVLSSQSAERIYRSLGPPARIDIALNLGSSARLDWLPQETILFSGARLSRRFDVEMAPDARLLIAETIVFGRTASGESMLEGSLVDTWRIHRGGQLVFADNVRICGAIERQLARPTIGGGARATSMIVYMAPTAEDCLADLRHELSTASCEWGASAWNGMLVARFMGPDTARVRADTARALLHLTQRPLPRVWQI